MGDLSLAFDAMELPADTGLTLTAYSAEPGSPSGQALTFLASWVTSPEQAAVAHQQASEDPPV